MNEGVRRVLHLATRGALSRPYEWRCVSVSSVSAEQFDELKERESTD